MNTRRLRFAWDERKNQANQRKHGVSLEEAWTVFFDENAIEFFDPDHAEAEDRFLLLGVRFRLRVVMVCHCHRPSEGLIGITSARKATRKERLGYTRRRSWGKNTTSRN